MFSVTLVLVVPVQGSVQGRGAPTRVYREGIQEGIVSYPVLLFRYTQLLTFSQIYPQRPVQAPRCLMLNFILRRLKSGQEFFTPRPHLKINDSFDTFDDFCAKPRLNQGGREEKRRGEKSEV